MNERFSVHDISKELFYIFFDTFCPRIYLLIYNAMSIIQNEYYYVEVTS